MLTRPVISRQHSPKEWPWKTKNQVLYMGEREKKQTRMRRECSKWIYLVTLNSFHFQNNNRRFVMYTWEKRILVSKKDWREVKKMRETITLIDARKIWSGPLKSSPRYYAMVSSKFNTSPYIFFHFHVVVWKVLSQKKNYFLNASRYKLWWSSSSLWDDYWKFS